MVVDPLVCVAGDEQVVGPASDSCPEEAPLRGMEILSLVDEDVVVGLGRARLELRGGGRGELEERAFSALMELALERLERGPDLRASVW